VDVEELRVQMTEAMDSGDESQFVDAIHPDAVFTTVVFGGRQVFRGKDGAREWWSRYRGATVYEVYSLQVERIDEHAILITARLRVSGSERGMEDAPRSWVVIERDGLIYRYQPVESRDEAAAASADAYA
jgi:hypothetical protein